MTGAHHRPLAMTATGLLLALALPAPVAAAACTATLSKSSADPAIGFDPFAGEAGVVDLALTIESAGAGDCQLGLAVASQQEGGARTLRGAGMAALGYVVETMGGSEIVNRLDQPIPIGAIPGGSTSGGSTSGGSTPGGSTPGGSTPGRSTNVTIRFRVPAGQMAAAGDFADRVRLRLVDLAAGQVPIGGDLDVAVRAIVPSRAQVNLAGSAGPFDSGPFAFAGLDFGELATGAERVAFVQVRATRPVTVRLTSQNRGTLRRVGAADPGEAVGYALSLDGITLPLADGTQSIAATPPVSLAGQSYPLTVRVTGDPRAQPAGEYRDVVTIDVTPD